MEKKQQNLFRKLLNKDIYAILDGDTTFEEYEFDDDHRIINISMPYLSGPDLCNLSTIFGLQKTYHYGQGSVNPSRWVYLEDLIEFCIKNGRCSELLAYLFNKKQFAKTLSGHGAKVINDAHAHFVKVILENINGILFFSGNELTIIGGQYVIREVDGTVKVQTPAIKSIDREYIRDITSRAMEDIDQNNYDSAITKSRTLLEEVFCYVIEKKNETPSDKGNMSELYKQVKDLYNMHGDEKTDKRINTLLSGLEKIVSAISEMRNKNSDAHGVGVRRVSIDDYHARLFVNASMTMADFVLSVERKANAS